MQALDQVSLAVAAGELAALRARRIGFVFQQFFLAEHQSVLGNVAAAAREGPS